MWFQKEKIVGYIILIIWIIGLIHAVRAYINFAKILPEIPYEERYNITLAKKKYTKKWTFYMIHFIKPFLILFIYIGISFGFVFLIEMFVSK